MSNRYPGMSDKRRLEIVEELRAMSERAGELYIEIERAYGKTRLKGGAQKIGRIQGGLVYIRIVMEGMFK